MQVDVRADLRAERLRVRDHPARPGDAGRAGQLGESLGRPQPQVHAAAARVVARAHAAQQQPRSGGRHGDPPERAEQQHPARRDPPPGDLRHPRRRREKGKDIAQRGEDGEPAESDERKHRQHQHALDQPGPPGCGPDLPADSRLRAERVEHRRHLRQPGVLIDVGNRNLGVLLPDPGHELRRVQAAATTAEEVGVRLGGAYAENLLPAAGEPLLGGGQLGLRSGGGDQWPGKRRPVHLSRRSGRQPVHHGQQRNERCRQLLADPQRRGRGVEVGAVAGHQVAHQELVARSGPLHRGGRAGDAGQRLQCGVHLTQLDPAPAELHLLVAAAEEQQTIGLRAHDVPAAVRPRPVEGGQRRELLGVLSGVEVARQADSADDQLAGLAQGDRFAGRVDHGEFPAGERQPDAHRSLAGQSRGAGDHSRLGRSVRVPDLASLDGQPLRELRRARLPAEDQQADVVERFDRPQRGKRRHRGHDRDALLGQPRTQVDAAAD